MKSHLLRLFLLFGLLSGISINSFPQKDPQSPQGWAIIASYTIPGKASGLAYDGTYIYFGIYGQYGNNVYKFNPATGTNVLQCTGPFEDSYGMTYKSPNLVTINQPSSSSQPSTALEFTLSGATVSNLTLPDHYMSGVAWDNNSWWVCTYYPNPGVVYHLNASGTVLSQFTPPSEQPWDICKQGNDLWIADYNANMLYKVNTTGTVLESHASANVNPAGVVYDGTYLWYCDGPLGANSTLYKVDLTGSGTPVITVPEDEHDYGTVAIGQNEVWNCQVQNTGNANLSITQIEIPTGQPVTTTFSTPQTITPGNSVNIPLKYTPTQPVPLNCQVIIHSSDPIHPETPVALTGTGVYQGPHVLLPEPSHNYGTRRAGAYSKWMLPVTNNGSQNLIISALETDNPAYSIDASVSLPITVASLSTANIPVWFHPQDDIIYMGVLSISTNSPGQSVVFVSFSGTGEVTNYPIGTPLWTYQLSGGLDPSPKSIMPLVDITGDGVTDIIVGSEDYYIRCFNGNASVTGDVLWERLIPSGPVYQQNDISTIDDINGDGYRDVIVGTTGGDEAITAFSGKTGQQLWKHSTQEYGGGGWVYQVDSKYDYNNDGFSDVLAATGDDGNGTGPRRVYCLDGLNGNSIWQRYLTGPVFSVIGVEDFTGDSKPDVVAGASSADETVGRAVGLDGTNGLQKWSYTTPGSSVWGLVQLDDITGDGKKDVAIGDFSGNLIYLNASTGTLIDQISFGPVLILRLVDQGDINNDGFRDVLVAHSGTTARVVDGTQCNYLWSRPLSDKCWCVANAGDITFDENNDVMTGTLYQNNNAYFIEGTKGTILTSYPAADPVDALNAIPDITGDSTNEMLFGDRSGFITCLSGGFDSTTIATRNILPQVLSFEILSNPNDGTFKIEINSEKDLTVDITLIDTWGRIRYKENNVMVSKGLSVKDFDLSNQLTTGVYYLKLKYKGGEWIRKVVVSY